MDEQHAVLMDTLNEIRLALVRGNGRDQVGEGMSRLIEFTRMHFACEEQLLDAYGFPGATHHRDAHQKLLYQIEETANRAQHHDELQTKTLLLFLRDWYMDHIEEFDRQYGDWLNERGVF